MKIGSKNRRVQEIRGETTAFDWGELMAFGSSYQEVLIKKLRIREIRIPLYNKYRVLRVICVRMVTGDILTAHGSASSISLIKPS